MQMPDSSTPSCPLVFVDVAAPPTPNSEVSQLTSLQPSSDIFSTTSTSAYASTFDSNFTPSRATNSNGSLAGKDGTRKRNQHGSSEVWEYFDFTENECEEHAFCLLCEKDVFYGGSHATSNLLKHFERHHNEEFKYIMIDRATKKQSIQLDYYDRQASITDCPDYVDSLLSWIVLTYQPLRMVESLLFRDMIACINSEAPLVSYGEICSMISSKYYDTLHSIKGILKGQQVALSTDAWNLLTEDGYVQGYVTCTLHFIEPRSWTIHHFSLGVFKNDPSYSSSDMVRNVEQHLEKFGISYQQLTCVVTDTESTMIAAGRLFKEKSIQAGGTTAWHGCIDHVLELVTKLAFKNLPNTHETMTVCRSIVSLFKSSSQATLKLKEKAKARLGVPLTVIEDECTRWWRTYSMCERLLQLKDIITIMYLEGDIRQTLTDTQWIIVSDLVSLLKPLMIAQRILEGKINVTISLVPYMLYKIRSGLVQAAHNPESSDQVKSIASLMLEKFNMEFGTGSEGTVATDHMREGNSRRTYGISKLILMALVLDPRTKSFVGIPSMDQSTIMQYVIDDLVDLVLSEMTRSRNWTNVNYADVANGFLDELDHEANIDNDFHDDDLQELDDATPPTNCNEQHAWTREAVTALIRPEIDRYKSVPGIKMRDEATGKFNCPLKWWKVHQHAYYYVSKLALKYLSIPATSAPSEHLFSAAGFTVAEDRERLDPIYANELVFLHDSIPALEEYKRATLDVA